MYSTSWESGIKGQLYEPTWAPCIYFCQPEQLLLSKRDPYSRAMCGWPQLVRTPLTSAQLKRCDSRVSPFNSSLCEAHVIIMHLLCQRGQQRATLSVLAPCSRPLSCLLSSTRFLSFYWFCSGTKRTLLNCPCGLFSWALEDSRLSPLFYPTLYHTHNTLNAWRRLTSGCQVRNNCQLP